MQNVLADMALESEGCGNVMCLDLLRALGKRPAARTALAAELALAGAGDAVYVGYTAALLADLAQPGASAYGAYGRLPDGVDCGAILARALVE